MKKKMLSYDLENRNSIVNLCIPGNDTCRVCFFSLLDLNVYKSDSSPLFVHNGINTAAVDLGLSEFIRIFGAFLKLAITCFRKVSSFIFISSLNVET
jgi:hypothetical protein